MDLSKVLAQLREERDALDVAIYSLERLDQGATVARAALPILVTKSATNGANPVLRPNSRACER
jgi:hypothetical protein